MVTTLRYNGKLQTTNYKLQTTTPLITWTLQWTFSTPAELELTLVRINTFYIDLDIRKYLRYIFIYRQQTVQDQVQVSSVFNEVIL